MYKRQQSSTSATPYSQTQSSAVNQNPRSVGRDTCKNCFQKGHWAKFCPAAEAHGTNTQADNARQWNNRTNVITGAEAKPASTAVYLKTRVNRRVVYGLLDSGCEHSVIKSSFVEHMELEPTGQRLFAANGTEIPVKGRLALRFTVHGIPTNIDVLVSDAVEDLILGADWLVAQNVLWDFKSGGILLNGKRIALRSRELRNLVRRIYVSEQIVVPPGHVTDVPVSVTLRDLRVPRTEWAMEPRVLRKNVLAARTLVNSVKLQSAVRVANIGDSPYQLSTGQLVGHAMPVSVDETCVPRAAEDADGDTPAHVACLLNTLPADMSAAERQAVEDFVQKNADVFSKSEYDIGRTHLARHRIDTGDHPPFREPLRRHPVAYLPIIDQHVDDMLANDIIEPAMSPWASNVVIIRKKDGTFRFCVDYRRLNDITRKDSYPLPRIDDCLSSLGGACYFSTLD